jgi:RimJ/RimL family protein N-acetyltransferase
MAEEEGVVSILESLKLDKYRWGNCQAIVYDRRKTDLFPPGFLSNLYFSFLGNRYNSRPGTGILEVLLCGFSDLSHDSVVQFFMRTPLVILGVWDSDKFEAAGCCFPTIMIGAGEEERACYCGYGYQRKWWGSAEQEVLTLLGLSILFQEMNLQAIHGVRFEENDLTAKYMQRFGFKDVTVMPAQMTRNGKLVPGVVSTLPRSVFESVVEKMVLEAYRAKKSE